MLFIFSRASQTSFNISSYRQLLLTLWSSGSGHKKQLCRHFAKPQTVVRHTKRPYNLMKAFLFLLLYLLVLVKAEAQPIDCQLRLYKTFQDYQNQKYTCWEVQDFRSLFFPRGRLKVKGDNGSEKLIQENYWGCHLVYQGVDSLSINQLFRFHPISGVALAYQQSGNGYAVYFMVMSYSNKPRKLISKSLAPSNTIVDEFQGDDLDGIRIILGKDKNGKRKPRSERKEILKEINAIRPSAEVMQLRKLISNNAQKINGPNNLF